MTLKSNITMTTMVPDKKWFSLDSFGPSYKIAEIINAWAGCLVCDRRPSAAPFSSKKPLQAPLLVQVEGVWAPKPGNTKQQTVILKIHKDTLLN